MTSNRIFSNLPARKLAGPFTRANLAPLLGILLFTLLAAPLTVRAQDAYRISKQYNLNKIYYNNLEQHKNSKIEARGRWLRGIHAFQTLYRHAPQADIATGCLFLAARMYEDLYQASQDPVDLSESLALYDELAAQYPQDRLADDSLFRVGELLLNQKKEHRNASRIFAKILVLYPDGDMAIPATANLEKIKALQRQTVPEQQDDQEFQARILDLRYGSTSYYTRIVIELSHRTDYSGNILEARDGQPRRLYFDLYNTILPRAHRDTIPVNDGLLQQIRSAQHSENSVRVVLDTDSFSNFQASTLENPFRIVIDVWGRGKRQKQLSEGYADQQVESLTLPQQLGLGARRIVIDPGHGGKDPGAVGPGGLLEKDVVLAVALRLRDALREKHGYEVFLTREKDEFLSLEERTELANTLHGDLFVSLHVNAAPSSSISGIETYFLSLASTGDEMRAAAKENAASNSQLSDLEAILMDLMQNAKINESAKLAEAVQDSMVSGLATRYDRVNNLGVKKAPFIVLIGAQMPSILTEIAFLSNPQEAQRIRDQRYLQEVASQIATGIGNYVDTLQGTTAASL
jgi:N-acetylmuramoyl-L-alanine amidase